MTQRPDPLSAAGLLQVLPHLSQPLLGRAVRRQRHVSQPQKLPPTRTTRQSEPLPTHRIRLHEVLQRGQRWESRRRGGRRRTRRQWVRTGLLRHVHAARPALGPASQVLPQHAHPPRLNLLHHPRTLVVTASLAPQVLGSFILGGEVPPAVPLGEIELADPPGERDGGGVGVAGAAAGAAAGGGVLRAADFEDGAVQWGEGCGERAQAAGAHVGETGLDRPAR
mmetsp:Transcript_29581/g.85612  ORF Transcript_29581/g.85612 Transcript_29581/m.85612 type:complete len:223 (-) Transcript_29581:221-889(-)